MYEKSPKRAERSQFTATFGAIIEMATNELSTGLLRSANSTAIHKDLQAFEIRCKKMLDDMIVVFEAQQF